MNWRVLLRMKANAIFELNLTNIRRSFSVEVYFDNSRTMGKLYVVICLS